MKLSKARVLFTESIVRLILFMISRGERPAFDEGLDRITVKDPTSDHMKKSLHIIGLAQDIVLYREDGSVKDKTEDHTPYGEWWESYGKSIGLPLRWGGRFKDGNHYSFEWQGVK